MIGWPAFILPFMEAASTHQMIDFNSRCYTPYVGYLWGSHTTNGPCGDSTDTKKVEVASATPDAFHCPSTPQTILGWQSQKDYGANGCSGFPERHWNINTGTAAHENHCTITGVFFQNSATTLAEILDGTSHTMLVLERSNYQDPRNQTTATSTIIAEMGGNPFFFVNHGGQGYVTATMCCSFWLPVNAISFDSRGSGRFAHGFHPGGVNGVMADGSVFFISDTVDNYLYLATLNRSNSGYSDPTDGCWKAGGGTGLR